MPTRMRTLWRDVPVLEYNGYRFPNTVRTESLRIEPVLDSAQRSVMYNRWTLAVRWYVAGLYTTDPEFIDLSERLTHPAGPLRYEGRGAGNPRVNVGGAKDLKWGPIPGPLVPHVVGAGNALRLHWSVSFAAPNCANARYEYDLMELVYTVTHAKDDAGFLDRTIAGHLSIPLTRPGQNQNLGDSADNYRRSITPPKVKGFHRKYGPWVLSEDRTRLDFEIRDEELRGEQLPPNVVEAECSDTVSSTQPGLRHWQGTISARYRMRKGSTGMDGARAFFGTVRGRLNEIQDGIRKVPNESSGQVIPVGFTATNPNRYGPPTAEFSLSYTFTLSLKHLMGVAGLWRPIPDSPTWEAWVASLEQTVFDPYGYAQIKFDPGTDRIVSLCGPKQSVMTGTAPPPPAGKTNELASQQYIMNQLEKAFPKPSPQNSWLRYDQTVWVESDDGVLPARKLPAVKLTSATDFVGEVKDAVGQAIDAMKLKDMPGSPSGDLGFPKVNDKPGTFRRTEPELYLYLRGVAIRAGYEIEPPRLIDVGGVKAVPSKRLDCNEGFWKGVKANGYIPLHYAAWNLRYYLPAMPSFVRVPPNPMLGQTEGQK